MFQWASVLIVSALLLTACSSSTEKESAFDERLLIIYQACIDDYMRLNSDFYQDPMATTLNAVGACGKLEPQRK